MEERDDHDSSRYDSGLNSECDIESTFLCPLLRNWSAAVRLGKKGCGDFSQAGSIYGMLVNTSSERTGARTYPTENPPRRRARLIRAETSPEAVGYESNAYAVTATVATI